MKFVPIPGEWGISGMTQVLGFFIPIPAIPGDTGNGNGNSREFFIPRTSLVSHKIDIKAVFPRNGYAASVVVKIYFS